MFMPFSRAVWAAALVLGAAMRLHGQETPANTSPSDLSNNSNAPQSDLPVVLEDFTVTGNRPALAAARWQYSRIPGFEILSSATESVTRDMVRDFNEFVFALNLVAPQLRQQNPFPVTMIICGDAAQYRELMSTDPSHPTLGGFLFGPDRSVILVNAQMQLLKRADGTTETAAEADRRFRRLSSGRLREDYLRFLFGRMQPAMPGWFRQGITHIYAELQISETEVTVGRVDALGYSQSPVNSTSTPLSQRVGIPKLYNNNGVITAQSTNPPTAPSGAIPLPTQSLISLAELLESSRPSGPQISQWVRQSELFVSWGLFGDLGRHSEQMRTFVERLRHEPPSEAVFRECFQLSYAEALQALRAHAEIARVKYFGVHAQKGQKLPRPAPAEVRLATTTETARLKAEVHSLAGRNFEARQELIREYRRGSQDPALLAALGVADLEAGEKARAQQFLEAAYARQDRTPRACLALARLRFQEHLARRTSSEEKLLTGQVKNVLEPVIAALTTTPLLEGYSLAAEVWLAAEPAPTEPQLRGLISGVQLAPYDPDLVYRVAAIAVRCQHGSAKSLIDLGLKNAQTASQRERLEQLARTLTPEKA